MVEERHTGWLVVLEKNGLHLVVYILENYGIDSETDVSVRIYKYTSTINTTQFRSIDCDDTTNTFRHRGGISVRQGGGQCLRQ